VAVTRKGWGEKKGKQGRRKGRRTYSRKARNDEGEVREGGETEVHAVDFGEGEREGFEPLFSREGGKERGR
jgi:hypothetical protein